MRAFFKFYGRLVDMEQKFNPINSTEQVRKPLTSLEALIAIKFGKKIELGKINPDSLVTDKDIEEAILSSRVIFGEANIPEIIKILREEGIVKAVPAEVKETPAPPKVEVFKAEVPKLESSFNIINDADLQERVSKNREEEAERVKVRESKDHIFEDQEALNELAQISNEILNTDINAEAYIQAGLYSKEEVQKHESDVARMHALYEERNSPELQEIKKIATIFEALIIKNINLSKCLGEDVIARPSFPVDDIFAPKIDSYLILKGAPLGLDVSMRNIESDAFTEKIERILKSFLKEKQEGIKYYKNKDGVLEKDVVAPKVVISAESSVVKELMYYLKTLSDEKMGEKLRSHRISRDMVSQIVGGCRAFSGYAKSVGRSDIAESYNAIVRTINDISKESPILERLLVGAGTDILSLKIQKIIDAFVEKQLIESAKIEDSKKRELEAETETI